MWSKFLKFVESREDGTIRVQSRPKVPEEFWSYYPGRLPKV